MSENVTLSDKDNTPFVADTFVRDEAGTQVHMQAVVPVDPVTGAPNAATEATLSALLVAINALNAAAAAIQTAAEQLNTKTTVANTSDVSGTVGVLGTVAVAGNVDIGNLPAVQQTTDPAIQAIVEAIQASSDSQLMLLSAMLEKMPRLDRTDRLTVDMADYGIGGSSYAVSYVNGVSNPLTGAAYYRMLEPWQFADAGSARLYQQIPVN